jgi:hypothetical protein
VIHDELRGNTVRILDRGGVVLAQFTPADCSEDRFSAHRAHNFGRVGGVYGAIDMDCKNAAGVWALRRRASDFPGLAIVWRC